MFRNIVVVVSSVVVALLLTAGAWTAGRFFAQQENEECLFRSTPNKAFELGLDMAEGVTISELGRMLVADIQERCPASVCAGVAPSPREKKIIVYVKGGEEALPEDFAVRARDLASEIRIVPVRFSQEEIQAGVEQLSGVEDERVLTVIPDLRANGIMIGLDRYDPLNEVRVHPVDLLSTELRLAVEQLIVSGIPVSFVPADETHMPIE